MLFVSETIHSNNISNTDAHVTARKQFITSRQTSLVQKVQPSSKRNAFFFIYEKWLLQTFCGIN
jgi:hypothetical protein